MAPPMIPDARRMSVDETATRMNRTNEAVYQLCTRALQIIRTELRSSSRFA